MFSYLKKKFFSTEPEQPATPSAPSNSEPAAGPHRLARRALGRQRKIFSSGN